MGTGIRTDITNITEDLLQNGPAYNVWQAVRIGEAVTRKNHPDRKDYLLDQAGLNFRPFENYEYPPTDIKEIRCSENELTYILTFLGLYGINSPIPRCYHEQVSMQQRLMGSEEVPLKNFLDIFNNRFYWLYYQSWKKYKYHLYIGESSGNKISERINSFIGKGFTPKIKKSALSDYTLLKFSGILSRRVRNKAGLLIILSHVFPAYTIDVKEFVPRWIDITDAPSLGDNNFRLGDNSFIGRSAVDYMSRIRLDIGPVDFPEYLNFLPGTQKAYTLKEILRMYLSDGLEYDIQFLIRSETIESVAWNDDRLRLGSTIWLGTPKTEYTTVKINYEEYN
jgi:type VI secretion system protein ImpH